MLNDKLTIQEFAKLVNKTQQGLYKRLKNPKDKLNNYVEIDEDGKKMILLTAAKDLYKIDIEKLAADPADNKVDPAAAASPEDNKEIIEILKEQIADQKKELERKNKQIDDLNERLKDITIALDQEQKLAAVDKQKLLALENKEKEAEDQAAAPEKKGFFAKLFNK